MTLAVLSSLRDAPAASVAEGAEHPSCAGYDPFILHTDILDMNSAKILKLVLKILAISELSTKFLNSVSQGSCRH